MSKGDRMPREPSPRTTTCSKGHVHPSWNTTGILRIAKCESVCGFCQKETKTAANLRKHVAIHIKNEGLNLTIAGGSSGRGRLEIPPGQLERQSPSRVSSVDEDIAMITETTIKPPTSKSFSPSAVLLSMANQARDPYPSTWLPPFSCSSPPSPMPIPPHHPSADRQIHSLSPPPDALSLRHQKDPFWALREHNLTTKIEWTAIPASEGFRVLDLCKSLSVTESPGVQQHNEASPPSAQQMTVPCYNRKVLFDEEWQAHMRDVHGVFLLWPETWMRRIEVLDLDAFGGDIGVCNDVIMASG